MKPIALFVGTLFFALAAVRAQEPSKPEDQPKKEDVELAAKLVGKWTIEIKETKISGTVLNTYRRDQTFESVGKFVRVDGQKFDITVTGTWKVANGSLKTTVEKAAGPSAPAKGDSFDEKITALGDKELKLKNVKGEEEVYKRSE